MNAMNSRNNLARFLSVHLSVHPVPSLLPQHHQAASFCACEERSLRCLHSAFRGAVGVPGEQEREKLFGLLCNNHMIG